MIIQSPMNNSEIQAKDRKNPNVGKPNERERDLIIQLQESKLQQKNHISNEVKYLTAPK